MTKLDIALSLALWISLILNVLQHRSRQRIVRFLSWIDHSNKCQWGENHDRWRRLYDILTEHFHSRTEMLQHLVSVLASYVQATDPTMYEQLSEQAAEHGVDLCPSSPTSKHEDET